MIIFYPASVGNPNYIFPLNVSIANNGISTPKGYTSKAIKDTFLVQISRTFPDASEASKSKVEQAYIFEVYPKPGS